MARYEVFPTDVRTQFVVWFDFVTREAAGQTDRLSEKALMANCSIVFAVIKAVYDVTMTQ